MKALMNALSPEEQVWFADLTVQAIWADGQLALREYEYFLRLVLSLEDQLAKTRLVRRLERGRPRPQAVPSSFPKPLLPQVYLEVASLMVCDWELDPSEREFLESLARRFGFEPDYHAHLIEWAEQGLSWQQQAKSLVPSEVDLGTKWVPLHQMSEAQRIWYAEVLVGAMSIDGLVDPLEAKLLKQALYFLPQAQKKRLVGMLSNGLEVPLLSPPNLEREVIFQVLFEVLEIVALNEEVCPKEAAFIADFIRVCNLPRRLEHQTTDWCEQGIFWRQQARALSHQVRFAARANQPPPDPALWKTHQQSSRVLVRQQHCWVCGEDSPPVPVHRLSSKAPKGPVNFFGVASYPLDLVMEGAQADFNGLRVHFCPKCLFASPRKEHFKAQGDVAPPAPLRWEAFKQAWAQGSQRRARLDQALLKEQGSLAPSPHWVRTLYQLAIDAHRLILEHHGSDEDRWSLISLMLTLAELLMKQGDAVEAQLWVERAAEEAARLDQAATADRYRLRALRLRFKVALYLGEERLAGSLIDQLVKLRIERGAKLGEGERNLLGAYLSEARQLFGQRKRYVKTRLVGFHLPDEDVLVKEA